MLSPVLLTTRHADIAYRYLVKPCGLTGVYRTSVRLAPLLGSALHFIPGYTSYNFKVLSALDFHTLVQFGSESSTVNEPY